MYFSLTIKINYSLNETKSRDFIYLVTATVENQECTFEYTKTMKKEKECTIKEGDSFLAYIDTKKQKAENSTAMKKEVKKNIIMFGICALVVIVFLLLLQQK